MPFKKGKTPKGAKPFQKGQSGNLNGRPKKFVSKLKAQGYKLSEINDCIKIMLSMTVKQIEQSIANPSATALETMIASAIQTAIKSGNLNVFETLLSRSFGRPKETVEIQTAPPEIEAAHSLYESLRENGLTKTKAINEVIKGAQANGYELTKADILDAETIS